MKTFLFGLLAWACLSHCTISSADDKTPPPRPTVADDKGATPEGPPREIASSGPSAVPYLDPKTGTLKGFLITQVAPHSPLARLRVHSGDIIVALNGVPVTQGMPNTLSPKSAMVIRNGKTLHLTTKR